MIYNTSGSYVNNMFKKLIKLYKTFANFYATRYRKLYDKLFKFIRHRALNVKHCNH